MVNRKAVIVAIAIFVVLFVIQNVLLRDDKRTSGEDEMPKFSEIVYERPDLDALTENVETLIQDLEEDKLSVRAAVNRLEETYGLLNDFWTMDTIAELRYYHDITQTYYADELDWFLDNEPVAEQLYEELCVASANCADAKQLDALFWGGWLVDAYGGQESTGIDQTYLALARRENALLGEYRKAFTEPTVTWRGAERSYWELQEDYTLTEEEWDEIQTLYYDKYATVAGEIYIQLVGVRQELAAYLGYDSYEALAYDSFGRDYSPAQAMALVEEIRTELAPLYPELNLSERWQRLTYTLMDEAELLSALKTAAEAMGGTIADAFHDMERYELCDITISEKKGNLSYQCYLYSYQNPFIFVKTEGYSDDLLKFGHEFGHFVDAWYNYDATGSEDLAEVFSQGMEYLLLTRVPERYRAELTEYKLLDAVDTFTQQSSFAAFEHEVYSRPAAEWTPEALNELSLELARDFGYLIEGKENYYAKSWFDISHFFDSPFYVISYCVSNDAAFRIYELECAEAGKGLDCWNRMLPRDSDSFLETVVDQGGLTDPFGADSVRQIAALLREKLK